MDSAVPQPNEELSNDHGDDVQRRYRYQSMYAEKFILGSVE
ncbi:MAG: hypothetical protein ACLQQ4_07250 [Bacteroidia bacterium]